MVALSSKLQASGSHTPLPDSGQARPVISAPNLPSTRAIVGGLLVALSVLGVIAVSRASTATTETPWVVVQRQVPAGKPLEAADLALAPMDLYGGTAKRAFSDPDLVIGQRSLVPLSEGDLLTTSLISATKTTTSEGRRLSIEVSPAQALTGTLRVGDLVDVVATPRSDAPAAIIVRGAMVLGIGESLEAGVGSQAGTQLTLVVGNEQEATAVIDAAARGELSLITASELGAPSP